MAAGWGAGVPAPTNPNDHCVALIILTKSNKWKGGYDLFTNLGPKSKIPTPAPRVQRPAPPPPPLALRYFPAIGGGGHQPYFRVLGHMACEGCRARQWKDAIGAGAALVSRGDNCATLPPPNKTQVPATVRFGTWADMRGICGMGQRVPVCRTGTEKG